MVKNETIFTIPYGVFILLAYKKKFFSPTFIIAIVLLSILQTAILLLHTSSLITRALLLYLYVFAWIFVCVTITTHYICGKDLWRIIGSFIKTKRETKKEEIKDVVETI